MGDHAVHALLAPRRDPLDVALDRVEDAGAEPLRVQLDEPLLGRAKERRLLAAPAVGVGVVERTLGDQRADAPEVLDDPGIRLPHREPGEVLHLGEEAPVVVHRVVDRETEGPAELVVLLAVARRDVDEARAGVHRDERRRRDRSGAVDPRVPVPEPDELPARDRADLPGVPEVHRHQEPVGELRRDDQGLAADRERHVLLVGVNGDREVRGQRPRGRGPDDDRELRRPGQARRRRREGELHVDRRGALVLVLDLRLGERRLAVHAPVDGLEPLVDEAAPDEAAELPRDHRLVGGRHRDVGVLPIAEDADPLELLALDVDEAERVLAAAPPLLDRVHRAPHVHRRLVQAELLVHLVLDRQAVAVPARHVDRVEAEHRARLHDHVLEHLVEHVAEVDVVVRVGRPVVEDPEGPAGAHLAQALVDPELGPPGEHPGLRLREVGLHREGRFRQIQRGLVVHGQGPNGTTRRADGRQAGRASASSG